MISKKLTDAIINIAKPEQKNAIIAEVFNHLNLSYDYNNAKQTHILEILVDSSTIINIKDVNLDYIKSNLKLLIYQPEKYDIKDIRVEAVDNIDCVVTVSYKYIEKVNENRDDISYSDGKNYINYLDYPQILK